MNTKFLLSPAYLTSVALMLSGAVLSGGRFMLIGWILCIVGVCLNAMTLVVLTNREQLYTLDAKAARGTRRGFDDRPAVVQRLDATATDDAAVADDADEESAEPVEEAAGEPAEAPAQKVN